MSNTLDVDSIPVPRPDTPIPADLTQRVMRLPRDKRGYPIPWFVSQGPDGKPDFINVRNGKRDEARRKQVCWVCGDRLGTFRAFVVGPTNTITRVSAEPPGHLECMTAAATICPFLVNPRMTRVPAHPDAVTPGEQDDRNPGVTVVYTTRKVGTKQLKRGFLFTLGPPESVVWWRERRPATLMEVCSSIAEVMPHLSARAEQEGTPAMQDLLQNLQKIMPFFPPADPETVAAAIASLEDGAGARLRS